MAVVYATFTNVDLAKFEIFLAKGGIKTYT